MTKPWSKVDDNGGRCESCNRPESKHEPQEIISIVMTDGQGGTMPATMWVCLPCKVRKLAEREAIKV